MSSFTETFDSEKGAPGLGAFTVNFRPGTQHILGPYVTRTSEVAGGPMENFKFDSIVFTSTDLGPNPSRDDVLAAGMFHGQAIKFWLPLDASTGAGWSISGPSNLAGLGGAEQGIGPSPGALVSDDTLSLALVLLAVANWEGFDYTVDASVSSNALGYAHDQIDTVRDMINKAIRATTTATEYRCTVDNVLKFAARGDDSVFRQTPQVILTTNPAAMRDGDLWAFKVSGEVEYDYGTEVAVCGAQESGVWSNWSSTYSGRLHFNIDSSATADNHGFLGSNADLNFIDMDDQLDNVYCRKQQMSLSVEASSLKDYMNAGDHVWVHAPDAFLYDDTESIDFAGEETHPIKLRTSAVTCPVRPTHGVYVIHNATRYGGTNAVVRLNDYVDWGEGSADPSATPATIEFDPPPTNVKLIRGRRFRQTQSIN